MSSHSEPFARPLGILFGIGILWFGTLLIAFVVHTIFFKKDVPSTEGTESETGYELRDAEVETAALAGDAAFRAVRAIRAG